MKDSMFRSWILTAFLNLTNYFFSMGNPTSYCDKQ